MPTILVTGGAGYIGSNAAKTFQENGYKVLILDNLSTGHKEFAKWGTFFQGDISDVSILQSIFDNYEIDCISHFAASALVAESVSNPFKYYENNVSNALVLLSEACKNKVKVFQFSSSAATYGLPLSSPITESHPQNPINPYGRTKLIFEQMLKDASTAHGINYSILRYFNAAGADPSFQTGEDHNPESHLVPIALDVALGKRKYLEIFGTDYNTEDGTCVRDYIHISDLANAHLLTMNYSLQNKTNSIYNLGNGKGYSVKEIVHAVNKITKKEITIKSSPRRAGDPHSLVASSDAIKKDLGFSPNFSNLDDIIKTAWEWHKLRFTDK